MDDTVLGEPADLLGLLQRVVLPVVRALVHDDESVDGFSLAWEGAPPSRGRSDLLLIITVQGEPFRWIALTQEAPPESEPHARRRLASDLEDFIAESRFGRGQLRPHPVLRSEPAQRSTWSRDLSRVIPSDKSCPDCAQRVIAAVRLGDEGHQA